MVLESNRDLVLRRLVETLSRDRTKHQVAEVTSLGLVQMTRKRLGLGLLETFSENCEHCQGRGVVVHQEPVGKARSSSAESPRKRRGSQKETPKVAPHAITDDTRNALAKIAASTVGSGNTEAIPVITEEQLAQADTSDSDPKKDLLESVLSALPEPPAPGTGRRRRRASSKGVVTPEASPES